MRVNCSRLLIALASLSSTLLPAVAADQVGPPPWLTTLLRSNPDRRDIRAGDVIANYYSVSLSDPSAVRFSLRVVFVRMQPKSVRLRVHDLRQEGHVSDIMARSSNLASDLVTVNGGYFATNDGKRMYPMGLVVSDGRRANRAWNWASGGVLSETADGRLRITSSRSFQQDESVREALQSKPLLVEGSRSGIHSDNHDLANRTAVALCEDGSILVAGAFSDNGCALSLYEFAAVLTGAAAVIGTRVAECDQPGRRAGFTRLHPEAQPSFWG